MLEGDKWLLISAELSLAKESWWWELPVDLKWQATDKAVAYFHKRLSQPGTPERYRMADAVREWGGDE